MAPSESRWVLADSVFLSAAIAAGPNFNSWWPSWSNIGAKVSAAPTGVNLTATNDAVIADGNNSGYQYDGGYNTGSGPKGTDVTGLAYTLNSTDPVTGGASSDGARGSLRQRRCWQPGGAGVTSTHFTLTNSGAMSSGACGNGDILITGVTNCCASDVDVSVTGNSKIYYTGTIFGVTGNTAVSLLNCDDQLVPDASWVTNGNVVSTNAVSDGDNILTPGAGSSRPLSAELA